MAKNHFIFTSSLFLFLILTIISKSQTEIPEKIIWSISGEHRTNELQIIKKVILPKGDITSFEMYYLDTTRYSYKSKPIEDPKLIKEIIHLLENGKVVGKEFDWNTSVSLYINYKAGKSIDIYASNSEVHVSDYEISATLNNIDPMINKLHKIADWKPYNPSSLIKADKIVLKYKKNIKTITDQKIINEFLSYLRESEPVSGTKCPFYNSRIYIHIGDKVISAAPAHDGCPIVIIEKNYFDIGRGNFDRLVKILENNVGFKIGI